MTKTDRKTFIREKLLNTSDKREELGPSKSTADLNMIRTRAHGKTEGRVSSKPTDNAPPKADRQRMEKKKRK